MQCTCDHTSLCLPSDLDCDVEQFPRGPNLWHSSGHERPLPADVDDNEQPQQKKKRKTAASAARTDLLAQLAQLPALSELKVKGYPFDYVERGSKDMMPESFVTTVLDGLLPSQTLSTLELIACVVAPASLSRSPSLRQLTSLDLSHSVVARNKGDVPADELLRVVSSLTALTSLSVRDFANYYSNCDGNPPA